MHPSLSLILEIQSGLVNAALVESDALTRERRIIHAASRPISGAPHADSGHLLEKMSKALSETLAAFPKNPGIHSVSRVDCILSSPWIVSQTKSIRIRSAKDTVVTKKIVNTAIAGERLKIEKETEDITGKGKSGLSFVEQKIFEIKVNGYPVADFEGRKAREIEIFCAISMSSNDIVSRIEDVVGRHVGHRAAKKVAYHSSILLGYAISRENSPAGASYILAHIHGELSDIVVIKNGITVFAASFPFGYSALVRHVSASLGESEGAAISKISLHSSDGLHREEGKRVSDAVDAILEEKWADQLLDTVSGSAAGAEGLPYAVFLSVPSPYYPHFKKALDEGADKKKAKTGILHKVHVFMIHHVNTELIHSLLRM